MSSTVDFIAVDLGASSGRLIAGKWSGRRIVLEELHRFPNRGVRIAGSFYWDVLRIWTEIQDGLRRYGNETGTSPASIGVDSWGVDFALLDQAGRMLQNPYHYRDCRTDGIPQKVFRIAQEQTIFSQTAVQTLSINTLFQLYAMVLADDSGLHAAKTLQMIPDLFGYFLTGVKAAEMSIASTTQMYMPRHQEWYHALLQDLHIPERILPEVIPSGSILSTMRSEVLRDTGLSKTFPVVAVASHDTASAVAAVPYLDTGSVFISSGTWSLMGVEMEDPITSDAALTLGFTNEIGAGGSILLMKNITGLWILQECLRVWARSQCIYSWDDMIAAAAQSRPFRCFIDPDAPEFHAPEDMPEAIRAYCGATGQYIPQTMGEVTRCCFESLSLKYSSVLHDIEDLTHRKINTIRIVGGGCLNYLLCQMTADACHRLVVSGPAEAAALGNIMLQAMATGHMNDIQSGRHAIGQSMPQAAYEPQQNDNWLEAYGRFVLLQETERHRTKA